MTTSNRLHVPPSKLKRAYDAKAALRDRSAVQEWNSRLWERFLRRLQAERASTLLEISAGPGHVGRFFQDARLTVVCTDLSPEMVRLCRNKGLEAYAMDFLRLDFPDGHFDALFA